MRACRGPYSPVHSGSGTRRAACADAHRTLTRPRRLPTRGPGEFSAIPYTANHALPDDDAKHAQMLALPNPWPSVTERLLTKDTCPKSLMQCSFKLPRGATRHKLGIQKYKRRADRQIAASSERVGWFERSLCKAEASAHICWSVRSAWDKAVLEPRLSRHRNGRAYYYLRSMKTWRLTTIDCFCAQKRAESKDFDADQMRLSRIG